MCAYSASYAGDPGRDWLLTFRLKKPENFSILRLRSGPERRSGAGAYWHAQWLRMPFAHIQPAESALE